ncbi:MAG: GTP 3',8-cyclase MoaA [Solirubrobacteraceae bacterium]|nr:GTP 3',8-cyclase MoaA [Solirubrobacteraceae bacterium]
MSLTDAHGRIVDDLRVSVVDRCNLRCTYCMPAEGLPWLDRSEILSFEELQRLVGVFVREGVKTVRLTGGEPLVRKDFPVLAKMLKDIGGIEDLSVTTNGVLLTRDAAKLVAAGIDRFNVSLDSLEHERFHQLTRRDELTRVLAGLKTLGAQPGVGTIKVNCVALRGVTEHEVIAFADLARSEPYEVRFIEFMPLDGDRAWRPDDVLTGEEIRKLIHATYPMTDPVRPEHATAKICDFLDGKGRIGFINPVSEPFCSDCNRLRLTADGRLRTCLFSQRETDLRAPMREGATDGELAEIIQNAVWRKELKHRVGEEGFVAPERTMSQIGG